ncbi:hypothetical protein EIP91_001668 [Steccherinum ochraceum]|uniref:Uncharacterized protein n=1 Tax=Steccherinum ochraceum TaxID=92696 RepID=A0A4R0RJU5_9APHY|nr:hypothetical protein EIP91_001668 [Steccherinum ochraceum]
MSRSRGSDWQDRIPDGPEARARQDEILKLAETFDNTSQSRKAARSAMEQDIRRFSKGPFAPKLPHDVDPACDVWARPDLKALVRNFYSFKVQYTKPILRRAEQGHEHIAYGTSRTWMQILVGLVRRRAPKGTAEELAVDLMQLRGTLAEELRLSRHMDEKSHFGRPELRILLDNLMASRSDPEYIHQVTTTWVMLFLTSARPSTLAVYDKEALDHGRYIKLRDIKIYQTTYATWRVEIFMHHIKGHNGDKKGKTVKMHCRPVQQWENVAFDLAPSLLVLLLKRGALTDISTVDELLDYKETQIHIRQACLDEPLLCAGRGGGEGPSIVKGLPQYSNSISATIRTHSYMVGFPGGCAYCFRRDGAEEMKEAYGKVGVASDYLMHEPNTNTASTSYLRGTASLDVVGARVGEKLWSSAELNEHTRPIYHPGAGLPAEAQARLEQLAQKHTTSVLTKRSRTTSDDTTDEPGPPQKQVKLTSVSQQDQRTWRGGMRVATATYKEFMAQAKDHSEYAAYAGAGLVAERIETMSQLKQWLEARFGKIQSGGSANSVATRINNSKLSNEGKEEARAKLKEHEVLKNKTGAQLASKQKKIAKRLADQANLNAARAGSAPTLTPTSTSMPPSSTSVVADGSSRNLASSSSTAGSAIRVNSDGVRLQSLTEFADMQKRRNEPSILIAAAATAARSQASEKPNANERHSFSDFFDPGAEGIVDATLLEGPPLDDIDVALVRAQYVRMLAGLDRQVSNNLACELCKTDPTVLVSQLSARYNRQKLLTHRDNFHNIPRQVERWYKDGHRKLQHLGDKNESKGTCFLCWTDRNVLERFNNQDALRKHIFRPVPTQRYSHTMDPRLGDPNWKGDVQKLRLNVTPAWVDLVRDLPSMPPLPAARSSAVSLSDESPCAFLDAFAKISLHDDIHFNSAPLEKLSNVMLNYPV